jgi:predicted DNA-binding transcriptional regulator AlpA
LQSDQRRLLCTREAAEFLGVSVSFLNKLRLTEDGPPFVKLGARVAYDPVDLDAWLDRQKRTSTGLPGQSMGRFPDEAIRSRVVAVRSDPFAASYLDPAVFDVETRTVTARTDVARRKLCELDLRTVFADLVVTVSDQVAGGH